MKEGGFTMREMGYIYLALRMYRGSINRGRQEGTDGGPVAEVDDIITALYLFGAQEEAEKIKRERRADYARYKRELEG